MMVMASNSHRWSFGSIRGEVKFILLLPSNWRVETMGEGDQDSWLLQNGGSWGCGNGGAGACWQTVEDGLWFFCNAFVWICWKWGTWEQNRLPWEHSIEKQWGRRGRDKKPNSVGGRGEAEAEGLILWLVVLEMLAGGWWWHEARSLIQGLLKTHILYTWL